VPPLPTRSDYRSSPSQRAGLVRVAFALAALTFADSVFPGMSYAYLVFGVNLVAAIIFQLFIQRGVLAGEQRSLWMGLFDIAFLTYVVYLLGPASSVMPFLYLLIPVLNATSSSSRTRVAMRLAGAGSLAYTLLLVVTGFGLFPHAPARPDLGGVPPVAQLVASGSLVGLSVLVTTSLVLRQMTALDRMNKRLAELSHLDELTGLYNRRYLLSELRRQLERVAREASCGVMMIDLDRFKRVNDEQGHDAGDLLLMDIAGALSAETRAVDIVARYGGDEFVIVLPDVTPEGLMSAGERVVAAVARVGRERWATAPVTASVGLTMARSDDDITTLLRRADGAAYAAKHAGGDGLSMAAYVGPSRSGMVPAPDAGKRRASG
jgi:diguanylate cyclase (GGDEF)-like protein